MLRGVLTALCALLLLTTGAHASASKPGRVEFEVYRGGKLEGSHVVEVSQDGDVKTVNVRIDLAGRVAGLISYGYTHRCTETWRGDELQTLACVDRERGKPEKRVSARREGGALQVTDAAGRTTTIEGPVLTSNWWNADLTRQSRMLDTRNGEVTPITIARIGQDSVAGPNGAVAATHYRLRGTATADLWYDQGGRWVKMAFRLRGQSFEYRLKSPLAAAPVA